MSMIKCAECGAEVSSTAKFCTQCGRKDPSISSTSNVSREDEIRRLNEKYGALQRESSSTVLPTAVTANHPIENATRFPALRTIAMYLKVVAIIQAGVSVIGAIAAFSKRSVTSSALGAIIMVAGAIMILFLWALAELIIVLLSIEENTRGTVRLLETDPKPSQQ